MHLNYVSLAALLPVSLLTGCTLGTQGTATVSPVTPAVRTLQGKAHGGQQAVSNSTVAIYPFGTTGYGSAGTALATGYTDADGNFNITYTCPSDNPNVPVYVLLDAGTPGPGQPRNAALVIAAGVGPCATTETAYITVNEVSTTALAYALSHFFSVGTYDGTTADFFGSPASLESSVALVDNNLIPTLLDVANGAPNPSTSTFTNEGAKIYTIANILGACVNSSGPSSTACSALFSATTSPRGQRPTDTLQAAINMALYPTQNVPALYSLVPPSGSAAFSGSLGSQPLDWTLAVSYTAPGLGLGVDAHTTSTLDIDTSGRVWFPSNLPGAAGVAYFDPSSASFSQVFTTPGMTRPQQVAIDVNGTVWANDMDSDIVAGFPASNPSSPFVLTMPGTTATALTIADDDSVRTAVLNASTGQPSFAEITGSYGSYTYSQLANTSPPGSAGFIGSSVAGDLVGGFGIAATYLPSPTTYDMYLSPNGSLSGVLFQSFEDAGQVAFTNRDFVSARGGYNAPDDGLCIYSQQTCFAMNNQATLRHPSGLAIDGSGALWLADNFSADVQEVPMSGGSYLNGSSLVNNLPFLHDSNNGGTLVRPAGIGIDATGNVWATNLSCNSTGCSPSAGLVLSELIGAGTPTINPVSAQVVLNSAPGMEPSVKTLGTNKSGK